MPELPEVETIKRGLRPYILNKKIVQVKVDCEKSFIGGSQMRGAVEGATVIDLRRRGKALLIDLDNGVTMMVHLRMTGQLIWRKGSGGLFSKRTAALKVPLRGGSTLSTASLRCSLSPCISSSITSPQDTLYQDTSPRDTENQEPTLSQDTENFAAGHPSKNFTAALPNAQTRVTFVFSDGRLFFNDQRKFGFVKVLATTEVELDKFIAQLGKEPWEMQPKELFEKCQRHARAPIKAVLLDQQNIAGLGNIYADEALFYAKVHPATLAGDLTEEQVVQILEGACKVMDASINSGGSTMATYVRPDGSTGDYLEKFAQVFRREGQPCYRCGAILKKTRCAGRGTHYCPVCQGEGLICQDDAVSAGKGRKSSDAAQDPAFKMPLEGTERR